MQEMIDESVTSCPQKNQYLQRTWPVRDWCYFRR